jgi:hypothetical protein
LDLIKILQRAHSPSAEADCGELQIPRALDAGKNLRNVRLQFLLSGNIELSKLTDPGFLVSLPCALSPAPCAWSSDPASLREEIKRCLSPKTEVYIAVSRREELTAERLPFIYSRNLAGRFPSKINWIYDGWHRAKENLWEFVYLTTSLH